MSGCGEVQARFTEYLDGRLNGREMHRIGVHLEDCRSCGREWESLRRSQSSLAALGPVPAPPDLLLRIRVAVSHELARSRRSVFGFGIGRKRREDLNRTTPVQAVGIKLWPLVVSREGGD